MRVVAHNGAARFGGGEKWTLLLLRGLAERGHEVHFFCRNQAMEERAATYGVSASIGVLGGHLMVTDSIRFSRMLRAHRPDAFLVSTYKKLWLAGMAARLAGVPTVVARIGLSSDLPDRHWTYRLAVRRWTDAVLVNADEIRTRFVTGMADLDPGRVVTVYDGIPLPRDPEPSRRVGPVDRARAARETLGLPTDARLIGAVTRLDRQKRIDRMIDALGLLPEDVHLVLAGEGPHEADLRARVADAGLTARAHFLGFRSDVDTVLAALDVFLITSDREGMANAMLEAMAAGIPVVSTRVSGAAEALDAETADVGGADGDRAGDACADAARAGVLVDSQPEAIATAIAALLRDPAEAERLGREGARRIRTRFRYDAMVEAWEHVLAGGDPAAVHGGPSPVR